MNPINHTTAAQAYSYLAGLMGLKATSKTAKKAVIAHVTKLIVADTTVHSTAESVDAILESDPDSVRVSGKFLRNINKAYASMQTQVRNLEDELRTARTVSAYDVSKVGYTSVDSIAQVDAALRHPSTSDTVLVNKTVLEQLYAPHRNAVYTVADIDNLLSRPSLTATSMVVWIAALRDVRKLPPMLNSISLQNSGGLTSPSYHVNQTLLRMLILTCYRAACARQDIARTFLPKSSPLCVQDPAVLSDGTEYAALARRVAENFPVGFDGHCMAHLRKQLDAIPASTSPRAHLLAWMQNGSDPHPYGVHGGQRVLLVNAPFVARLLAEVSTPKIVHKPQAQVPEVELRVDIKPTRIELEMKSADGSLREHAYNMDDGMTLHVKGNRVKVSRVEVLL